MIRITRGLISAGALLFALTASAQYDTTYGSSYYRQKVTQYYLLPDTEEEEVVFLGDSITDIAEWAEIFKNKKVKNRGISADVSAGVLNRIGEVIMRKPAKVFIMIGINDIADKVPDSVIVHNYATILNRIKAGSPKTQVYVQSILPTNSRFQEFARHQNKQEHIVAINRQLKVLAESMAYTYINLYDLMKDQAGQLDTLYTNDGLHLTGAGYMKWKEVLLRNGYMD